ncbi:MAG: hypothetical protein NTZ59_02380 [Bacteroidetes bacterium]|nr:hypothetical protein [Bacteroidota bacterium]
MKSFIQILEDNGGKLPPTQQVNNDKPNNTKPVATVGTIAGLAGGLNVKPITQIAIEPMDVKPLGITSNNIVIPPRPALGAFDDKGNLIVVKPTIVNTVTPEVPNSPKATSVATVATAATNNTSTTTTQQPCTGCTGANPCSDCDTIEQTKKTLYQRYKNTSPLVKILALTIIVIVLIRIFK